MSYGVNKQINSQLMGGCPVGSLHNAVEELNSEATENKCTDSCSLEDWTMDLQISNPVPLVNLSITPPLQIAVCCDEGLIDTSA